MPEKTTANGGKLREGLKIRLYIMSLIYANPCGSVLIPSSMELAARFKVARSTVTNELKLLCDEGYLVGKRGIGTFTNHLNFVPHGHKMPPLIGIVAGDGKYFYYPHQVWAIIASAGTALTRAGVNIKPIQLTGSTEQEVFDEISNQYLDGLIWINSPAKRASLFQRLRGESGIRFIVEIPGGDNPGNDGIDSFHFDFEPAGREIGRTLMEENRQSLFFIFSNPVTDSIAAGIQKEYAEAGRQIALHSFGWNSNLVFDEIYDQLAATPPDAIYIHGEHFGTIFPMLKKLNINTHESCRVIAESHAVHDVDFTGVLLDIPFEVIGRQAGRRMLELFAAPEPALPLHKVLEVGIRQK